MNEQEKEELYLKWNIPKGKTVFALHSRIEEVKNHLSMVEVVNKMPDEYRNKLVFICSGEKSGEYYERVIQRINQYHLNNYFIFMGWANTREVLGIANALVVPTTKEGFLLTAAEAFLMKIPVYRTRTAGFDDQLFCNEIYGDDFMKDASILMDYIDKGLDQSRIDEAYKYAIENFTIEKMTKKTVNVYKTVLIEK